MWNRPVFAPVDERPAGAFDFGSNLSAAKTKNPPNGGLFVLAKDCDFNKMRVIVNC